MAQDGVPLGNLWKPHKLSDSKRGENVLTRWTLMNM